MGASWNANATNLRQSPPDCTGLLGTEVKRKELLLLVQLTQILPRLLVGDSQDTGDGFADGVASCIKPP